MLIDGGCNSGNIDNLMKALLQITQLLIADIYSTQLTIIPSTRPHCQKLLYHVIT